MSSVFNWIRGEWSDPATHAWLVAASASVAGWMHGALSTNEMAVALVGSAVAIVIPPAKKP